MIDLYRKRIMNKEMMTQLCTDDTLIKVIWEAICYMYFVFNRIIINKLTHTNHKAHCLKIQHCLIIKHFITHNTLKHCSKVLMIQNNVWLYL